MTRHKLPRGFTLIELLIAVSIFLTVMLGLYTALQTGIQTYNKLEADAVSFNAAGLAFGRITQDLRNSFGYTNEDSRFKADSAGFEFFTLIDFFNGAQRLSQIARLKYGFADKKLERSAFSGLLAVEDNAQPEILEFSDLIKDVSFRYAASSGETDNPYIWQDSWPKDDTQKNLLPLAVKIKIKAAEMEFSKTVSLLR